MLRTTRGAIARLVMATAVLLAAATALAQVTYRLGGSVGAELGVAIDGTIPVAAAEAQLALEGEVGSGFLPDATFVAEVAVRYDAAREEPFQVRLGRAYATLYVGELDLSLGNQVVAWGSVDVVNPVDVINPRDMSDPMADPADQRRPTPLLRATWHAPEGVTIDLVLVPVFIPSDLPGARWQPETSMPTLPPGVTIVGVAEPLDERPALELANVQLGGRVTMDLDVGGGADVSVTAYRGFRHLPTSSVTLTPTPTPGMFIVQPVLAYDRITLLGTDFSAVVGDYVVRGEAAYTFGDDRDGTDPAVGNDTFAAVIGAETNVSGGPFLTLQAAYQRTAPDAGEEATESLSSVLAATFTPDNRLTLDVAWLHEWLDGSGAVRPSLGYTFADGLVGTLDATVLYGREGSTYGAWSDNTRFGVGVKFSF